MRHNEIWDFTASLLDEVCGNVQIEPTLIPLSGETQLGKSANTTSSEAHLDLSARGFGGDCFARMMFDVRIFHPNASSVRTVPVNSLYVRHEKEKRRRYEQRVKDRRRHICSAGLQHCRRNGSLFKYYLQAHCSPVGGGDWTKLRRHDQCCALPAVVCIAAVCDYSTAWFTTPCANFHQFSASACIGRGKSATLTIDIFFSLSSSPKQSVPTHEFIRLHGL